MSNQPLLHRRARLALIAGLFAAAVVAVTCVSSPAAAAPTGMSEATVVATAKELARKLGMPLEQRDAALARLRDAMRTKPDWQGDPPIVGVLSTRWAKGGCS